jgi:hypothetical protein
VAQHYFAAAMLGYEVSAVMSDGVRHCDTCRPEPGAALEYVSSY